EPTPLGGFAPFDAAAGPADASAPAEAEPPPAGVVPPTRSVAPLAAMASTAAAMPVMGEGGTPATNPDAAARPPGGTAVLHNPARTPAMRIQTGVPAMPMGTPEPTVGSRPAPPAPYVPGAARGRAKGTAKRSGVLSSLPAILLLAACVSGTVVGGMY